MNIKKLKAQGEMEAEQGLLDAALFHFDQALITALKRQQYAEAVNVLGHRLHIYKIYFQKTGIEAFMELLFSDIQAGIRICEMASIRGQPLSVMLLRLGDYQMHKRNFAEAVILYRKACLELGNSLPQSKQARPEYLAKLGWSLGANKQTKKGLLKINLALKLLQNQTSIRPFHQLIIKSGILMRKAECLIWAKNKEGAAASLNAAEKIGQTLKREYGMGERISQIGKIKKILRNTMPYK